MKIAIYIIGGLIAVVIFLFFILGKKSQKGTAIGLVDGTLAACSGKPNCVSSEASTADKFSVSPITGVSLSVLKTKITELGGVVKTDTDTYFATEFTSGVFKFIDDLEVRQDGDKIQIRSASRVGYSDRGVNKKRVEALRVLLEK
ncbi:MAG: DUF1499 domain-containing protein [Robiginitomaculum sp.]